MDSSYIQATNALVLALPVESLFPLVDMWRLAFKFLDPIVGSLLANLNSTNPGTDPITMFLPKTINALDKLSSKGIKGISKLRSHSHMYAIHRFLSCYFIVVCITVE